MVTPGQRNVNCLSTQIPFIARAHRHKPGGLCFPQVICLHTLDPQLDGEIFEIKDLVHYHPKLPPASDGISLKTGMWGEKTKMEV